MVKKYGVATAMPPYTTLRRLLVHIKSKVEQEEEDEEIRGGYSNAPYTTLRRLLVHTKSKVEQEEEGE